MGEAIAQGGEAGQNAFVATVSALAALKDPLKQNQAGVALFGTQWEDVRKKVILSMSDAVKNIQNVDGATKKAGDALQNNFGTKLQKMWRDVQDDFKPVGDDLLKIAKDTLPKVADSVKKVTGAFANMSPETRKTVIEIAGIAAAVGPVAIGLGSVVSIVGTLGKALAPVIGLVGAEGLAGGLAALAGPVGLTVVGLGLAGGAAYSFKKALDESKKANLEHAQSLVNQQNSLRDLSTQYESLRDKNKLSNDELLRFRDIQSELKTATSAEEIAKLKDEADKLQQKSGLSNKEMDKMLSLNDQIIKKTPEVKTAFSERGNAIVQNKSALDEVNARLAENARLELENQLIKAKNNEAENIKKYADAINDRTEKQKLLNQEVQKQNEIEKGIRDLQVQEQNELNNGQKVKAFLTQQEIDLQQGVLDHQKEYVNVLTDEVSKKVDAVDTSGKQLEKTKQLYSQMIDLQLAQAGINAKGDEGIAQLNESISKTASRKAELIDIRNHQGGLNAQQQEELNKLNTAYNTYTNTKSQIKNIQSEQQAVNGKIDQATGKAQGMNTELGKGVKKDVNVDDKGKAKVIHDTASKDATKTITIGALISSGFRSAVKAFEAMSHIDIPGFAVGTNFAPGGLALVGEQGPELMYVPRGAQIKTASQTRRILNQDSNSLSGITNNFNFERMLEGTVFNVREEADIKKVAKEFYSLTKSAARGKGVIMT